MAKLDFISAPEGLKDKPYKYYRDWLNINFYEQLCSYCLLQFKESLQIEHHEPQKYAEDRINDPDNLLLGCSWCNSGKKDYHPNHISRKRLPVHKESRGFNVIDIRVEDFAELFKINTNGELSTKAGGEEERVKFNIVDLLRLNTPSYNKMRERCLRYVDSCECLLNSSSNESQAALKLLVTECAERYLFYKAFNIQLSDALRVLIEAHIKKNIPNLLS